VNQILLPLNTEDIKLKRTLTANKSILDVSDANMACLSKLTQHMLLNRQISSSNEHFLFGYSYLLHLIKYIVYCWYQISYLRYNIIYYTNIIFSFMAYFT
jgi:hypothetical protein